MIPAAALLVLDLGVRVYGSEYYIGQSMDDITVHFLSKIMVNVFIGTFILSLLINNTPSRNTTCYIAGSPNNFHHHGDSHVNIL